eukprot:COSAG05_NODE_2475_length_3014_cov_3.392453_3_plen_88_part_00
MYLPTTHSTRVRVRADIIGHARINMYVNLSHACFELADYFRTHRTHACAVPTCCGVRVEREECMCSRCRHSADSLTISSTGAFPDNP